MNNVMAAVVQKFTCLYYLRKEGTSHKLFVFQEGDTLAAVQLLSQVSHIRLELSKSC